MAVSTVKAIINGNTYNLSYNSSTQKWEATVTAPNSSSYPLEGHYYPITIQATDAAGNVTIKDSTDSSLGTSLRLQVKEKVAPVITISAPTSGAMLANNKPTITWSVSDNDSGVDPASIKLTIDSTVITTGITKTVAGKGFNCSYTPASALADGNHTIKFDASDNDGNAASQKSVTFKVDTVPPTLTVSSPADGIVTNASEITVSGTTNDATTSPVTLTIKLNNGSAQPVTVEANGSFSKALTLAAGTNTITVTATDGAGKSTTVVRTVVLDQVAPTITAITLTPNPVDAGATYIISVSVTD
jgi:hypothetical protein